MHLINDTRSATESRFTGGFFVAALELSFGSSSSTGSEGDCTVSLAAQHTHKRAKGEHKHDW